MKKPVRRRVFGLAAFAAVTMCATSANAALIVRDLHTNGDGLLTYDTVSGLEWLDLSVSLGRAPLSVLSTYTDFRMATRGEVETLLFDAGIPYAHMSTNTVYADDLDAGHLLRDTIGVTVSAFNGAVQQIHGRFTRPTNDRYDLYFLEIRTPPAGFPGTLANFVQIGNTFSGWQSNHADFLVRTGLPEGPSPVPEPGSLIMGSLGLIGIGILRRRAA